MALIQKVTVQAQGVASVTANLSGVTAGNLLTVQASANQYSDSPSVIVAPTGYSTAAAVFNTGQINGSSYAGAGIFYKENVTAGAQSATLDATGTAVLQGAITLAEWSGYATSASLDASATNFATYTAAGAETANSGTTAAVAQASELVLGVMLYAGQGADSNLGITDPPTGYTSLAVNQADNNQPYVCYEQCYQESTSLSGAQSINWNYTSSSTSQGWAAAIATFKASGGSSGNALGADIAAQPEILGSMHASQSLSGAATIYPFARGQFRQVNAALALASVSPAMEGSAQARQQAEGFSVAQPVVQGMAQAIQRLSAGVSLQPAVAGSFTVKSSAVSLTGAITVQPGVSGAMTARQGFAGAILLQPEVSGVLTASQPGVVSLVGAIAVQPGMAGYLSARQSAPGSVTAPARVAGSFTGINALAGGARALPSVAGAWLGFLRLSTGIPAPYAARGTAYAWQALHGDVILQPDISGSIHPPFVGYPADPHYYAVQPARFFYAAAPFRAFYAKAPFRSFYALCQSDMAVPIPYAIDPSETKVLTLDATADLPSGVTLTGTPTVDVVVLSGSDGSAAAHFTGAVMNSTPITVDTATGGTVTIATGLAVQLIASGCVDGVQYEIRITCQTSQSNNVEVLKATLTCSAS